MKKFALALFACCVLAPAIPGCSPSTEAKKPDEFAPLPGGGSEEGGDSKAANKDKTKDAVEPLE